MSDPKVDALYPRATADFLSWFRFDVDCRDYLEWLRWPDGFVCTVDDLRRPGLATGQWPVHVR